MKKLLLTTAVAIMIPFGVGAQQSTPTTDYSTLPAGKYSLDKPHASLIWKVSHVGLSDYTARFTKFDADLDFNASDPTQSSLTVTVDPTSIKTDYPGEEDFDQELSEKEEWFNAGEYPEITFTSTDITMNDDNTGTVTGDLTFLGVTKPVTLDVVFNGGYEQKPFSGVPALGFSASGSLMRSNWGFDTYVPGIGDEVTLLIETEFHKDQADTAPAVEAEAAEG